MHAHGTFLHRLAHIGKPSGLRLYTLPPEQTGQDGHQAVGGERPTRHFLAREHSHINHRHTPLQLPLAAVGIVHQSFSFPIPRVVALEKESYAVERHTRLTIHPRVVGVDMEEEPIHAKGKVAVKQRLEQCRRLIPHAPDFGKSFGLHDALAVDMRPTDGIEHIIGLVVGGRTKPKFPHREVGIFVVFESVGHKRRCYTLVGDELTVAVGELLKGLEKLLVHQVVDREAHIPQHLFAPLSRCDGHSRHHREPRQEVISPADFELFGKMCSPVLCPALPTVYMEILHHR